MFLPARYAGRRPAPQGFNALRTLGIAVGYSDVFGVEPTWNDLLDRVRQYSLLQIVDLVGRVSTRMGTPEPFWLPKTQDALCGGIFGPQRQRVWETVLGIEREVQAKGSWSPIAIFSELQLLNLLKVAFLVLPVEGPEGDKSVEPFGEALLMVSDLIRGTPAQDEPDLAGWSEGSWPLLLLANGLFNHGADLAHELARSYDLYLTDKPGLRGHPDHLYLPALARHTTGLGIDVLWAGTFAIAGHWLQPDDKLAATTSSPLDPVAYFTTGFEFSRKEAETLFGWFATDADAVQREVRELYSRENLQPYHLLPFEKHPLFLFGDRAFCASVQLACRRLTRGFYHLFRHPTQPRDVSERFQRYLGAVFADYVDRLLVRAYPESTGRFIRLDDHARGRRLPICDFAVLYGDGAILLECKAKVLSLSARAATSPQDLHTRCEELYIASARQLDATIRAIEWGEFRALGLNPDVLRRYYPVTVALDDVAMNAVLYRWIERRLQQESVLGHPKVRPYQVLDIGELELVESAVLAGTRFDALLEAKTGSPMLAFEPFRNYYLALDRGRAPLKNSFLHEEFERISQDALRFFEGRQRSGAGI